MRLKFLKPTNRWRSCECRWSRYWLEKCDWKFCEVDQRLEMLRAVGHNLGARNAIEIYWSRPRFGDVAGAAGHDIGASCRNAIEIFWSGPSFGDDASVACHNIGARNEIEHFWSAPSFGDVASVASYDIGARNVIEIFWIFNWDKALGTLIDLSHLRAFDRKTKSRRGSKAKLRGVDACARSWPFFSASICSTVWFGTMSNSTSLSSPQQSTLCQALSSLGLLKFQSFRRTPAPLHAHLISGSLLLADFSDESLSAFYCFWSFSASWQQQE